MPLHLSHRPRKLEDVLGNESTVKAIAATLAREDRPHTWLLHGPSGCGKTTLARIIARSLSCSKMDFHEINTADFRGIDTARDLIRQMPLKPMNGPVRVWLIDEAHQLSKDAQNALLKALEDTPAHVHFVLATTDPDKLIATVRNRCSSFEVKALSDEQLIDLMESALDDKKVPQEVLEQIASDALGSPRAALVVLDKIMNLPADEMAEAAAQVAQEKSEVIALCRAIMKRAKWPEVAKIIKTCEAEPESIRRAVRGYFAAVVLNSGDERAYLVMDAFSKPFYDDGRNMLVMACYEAVKG